MNDNPEKITRFLQTWIYPNKKDLPVQYGSKQIKLEQRHNTLYQMICGVKSKDKAPIQLMQDVNVFVSELDKNKTVEYDLDKNRQAYLVCAEGKLSVNNGDFTLDTREAARLYGPISLTFTAIGEKDAIDDRTKEKMPSAHIMMIEMAQEDEWDNQAEPDANGKDGAFSYF